MPAPEDVRLPSIEALRAFEAVARLGSFERAAELLSVTASAIGKRIASLEEMLGTPMLVRGAKPLALTAAGKEYLDQVKAALELLSSVPLHQRASQKAQRLRVRATPTFARQVLVPALESFTQGHPSVELEVVLSIPFLDATPSEADVEVRTADTRQWPEGGRALMPDVVVPMAAPSLLARLPAMKTPADLKHATLLRTPLEPWTPWLRAAGLDWPEPSQGPRLVDLGLTLEAAVNGQGIALARPTLARHWLAAGSLKPLFGLTVPATHQYLLIRHSDSEAAQAFADWLWDLGARISQEAQKLLQARLSGTA